jgi:hypothetical protein
MKKLTLALSLALRLALAVGTGVANASHSDQGNSTGPPKDFAVGGGKQIDPAHPDVDIQFAFSAHSGPLGEDPKGHVQLFFPEGVIHAEVTCVIIAGNEAFITAVDDELPGGIVVVHAVDNGEPSDGTPDLARGSFAPFIVESTEQPGCFLPTGELAPVPVTQGNIVVHDGQPM